MRDPALSSSTFPIARCDRCDRSTLTYLALGQGGEQRRLCVHCDSVIDSRLEWITADQLEREGYQFGEPATRTGGGCGGGCGSGGCSTRGN
jgi:hypothetical protein